MIKDNLNRLTTFYSQFSLSNGNQTLPVILASIKTTVVRMSQHYLQRSVIEDDVFPLICVRRSENLIREDPHDLEELKNTDEIKV